ncbi:hypothetical protein [Mycetocola saprophilus]|uniref:hypothetical protein n=1 Tax=Mycetocola saprophilus TaxID=76636 RepID=UPI003BEF6112
MAFRDVIRTLTRGRGLSSSRAGLSAGIVTPWQTTVRPERFVWDDVFGTETLTVSREEAMTVPPVVKGRAIITGTLAAMPLRLLAGDDLLETPDWLATTEGAVTPLARMAWTLDDLIFTGMSLWAVERDAADAITTAMRVPVEWWHIDANNEIIVQGEPVDESEVILFLGPQEGFLELATRTMRGAVALEKDVVKRSAAPIPLVELHEITNTNLTDDEAADLVASYVQARMDPMGAVAFTPANIELKAHGETAPDLSTAGRNFVKIDVANFLNLPASILDGSVSEASLTYSTTEGKRNELADYGLSYWGDAIAARLSQSDVTAKGQRVRFDYGDLRSTTPSPTGPVVKD